MLIFSCLAAIKHIKIHLPLTHYRMDSKMSLLFSFFFLFCNANAFNITKLLDQYPAFSTFNSYLTQTQLANNMNSRQTITVLVVDNDNISPLSGKSINVLRKIMSVHVVLDYYDVQKLQNIHNKSTLLTTLFQSTGQASGQQGFINVTDLSSGSVMLGSAAKGATLGANLVKAVLAQPYNISILQISTVIVPLGIENSNTNSSSNSTSPSSSPSRSPAPAKSPSGSPPAPTKSPSVSPPRPSKAPAKAPSKATAPADADTPSTAPTSNPPAADADGSPSIRTELQFSLSVLMMVVPSAMCLLLAV